VLKPTVEPWGERNGFLRQQFYCRGQGEALCEGRRRSTREKGSVWLPGNVRETGRVFRHHKKAGLRGIRQGEGGFVVGKLLVSLRKGRIQNRRARIGTKGRGCQNIKKGGKTKEKWNSELSRGLGFFCQRCGKIRKKYHQEGGGVAKRRWGYQSGNSKRDILAYEGGETHVKGWNYILKGIP